ncbi:MAG: hypothetical protein FWE67_04020 [Planctomycetaceae bacterium]|nr:hypothetical protein [Planctomycetaceae bacterium]
MTRKVFFVAVALLFLMVSAEIASAQETEERTARERRREQRQQGGNPFPGGPSPGTISVMVRSGLSSFEKGFGNTFVLLASNGPETRDALGLSEEKEKEFIALRNELQGQLLQKMPQYANRFMKMTEADHKVVQEELEKEFQAVTDKVDKIATLELKQNARKTVFQWSGGLDSPLMNPDTIETLNLTEEQKTKVKTAFKELEAERKGQVEEFLKALEKQAALGGRQESLTPEEWEKFEKEMEALANRAFATGKKLGEALRKHLTKEQLELEKKLLADRPKFMPPLPPQLRGEESEEYRPGADSWRPGQGAPKDGEEKKRRPFPLFDLE